MVLDSNTKDKIKTFVYQKPRTINEIAHLVKKSWRTADRYVRQISETTGEISLRTFRKGTRGALKIVYWSNLDNIYSTKQQEKIFDYIEKGMKEADFSPFEIYQYIEDNKRKAETAKKEKYDWILKLIKHAKEEILVFSGNLSWVNAPRVIQKLEAAGEKGLKVKVLGRIDYIGWENTERILAINDRLKKEIIEVRHDNHPLRAFIIDNKLCKLREIVEPSYYEHELSEKIIIYYEIYDKDWITWLRNIFWKKYQKAIPAAKRIEDFSSIKQKQLKLFD
jgi:hypothetical protein